MKKKKKKSIITSLWNNYRGNWWLKIPYFSWNFWMEKKDFWIGKKSFWMGKSYDLYIDKITVWHQKRDVCKDEKPTKTSNNESFCRVIAFIEYLNFAKGRGDHNYRRQFIQALAACVETALIIYVNG